MPFPFTHTPEACFAIAMVAALAVAVVLDAIRSLR